MDLKVHNSSYIIVYLTLYTICYKLVSQLHIATWSRPLSRPLKYYDMEKITLCFNLSTKEQSNYRAKQSPGRPNKEKSKKIW